MSTATLIARLTVDPCDDGRFAARNVGLRNRAVFGGQLAAQALGAAAATVDPAKVTTSLHVTYLEPGDPADDVTFTVDRLRDGRSDIRQVHVHQGRRCAIAVASFAPPGVVGAFDRQVPAPEGPGPLDVPPIERMNGRNMLVRADPAHSPFAPAAADGDYQVWFCADGAMPEEWLAHHQFLAYVSDLTVTAAPFRPLEGVTFSDPQIVSATRTLHLWFHREVRCDQWHTITHRLIDASAGRALVHAHWFDESGVLVASITQETVSDLRGT